MSMNRKHSCSYLSMLYPETESQGYPVKLKYNSPCDALVCLLGAKSIYLLNEWKSKSVQVLDLRLRLKLKEVCDSIISK